MEVIQGQLNNYTKDFIMSANVENMAFFGATPWHGLGTPLEETDLYDIQAGLTKSGTDWEVRLDDLFTQDGRPAPAKSVTRTTDNSILGVVGNSYNPLQNRDAFAWFQPFLDTKMCALHTAGSLNNGKKVWVLAQIASDNSEIVKGDEISKFLMLSNSHDGTNAVRVGLTPIRIECANTLAMAHRSADSKLIRLRHSANLSTNLDNVRDIINLANNEFEATADQFRHLASKSVNHGDLRKYVKILQGIDNIPDEEISTRAKNTLDEIVNLALNGKGSNISGVGGTWWAAYNGYAEYLSWNAARNANNRLNNLWFGQGGNKNSEALSLALKMAG